MVKVGDYIKRIEIDALWGRSKHVIWDLDPEVNVLSGVNGVGKSTIIRKAVLRLLNVPATLDERAPGVSLTFFPEDANTVRYDVIRSFDRPLLQGSLMEKIVDAHVATELDWQLYQLQRRYLDYQVNVGNRMIEMLTGGELGATQKAQEEALAKSRFYDMIDELFSETGKQIDRHSNEIFFMQLGERLTPYQLSSGEKQMLAILLTVLVQDRQPYVLFMDEPEVSLHIEWQQRLIELIRNLNPKVQIILTTHAPAVVMNGWLDCVTEVSDIIR